MSRSRWAVLAVVLVIGGGVAAVAFASSSRSPYGTLRVQVSLGDVCSQPFSPAVLCRQMAASRMHAVVYGGHGGSQTNRVLTAGRDGEITANLPPGSYWIAFSYKDTATITNRGHEPFLIRSGKSTSLPPIMPDKYAIQAADAAPQR